MKIFILKRFQHSNLVLKIKSWGEPNIIFQEIEKSDTGGLLKAFLGSVYNSAIYNSFNKEWMQEKIKIFSKKKS